MDGETSRPEQARPIPHDDGITRGDLQRVIRRAAELYASEADAEEAVSSREVLRIGAELGLPERYVRQALFELPEAADDGGWLRRIYGPRRVAAYRSIPGTADFTLSRLEDYFTIREFLQVRRRQPDRLLLGPAHDPISRIARAVSRPSSRYRIAHADRIEIGAQPLDDRTAHVRIDLDLAGPRREAVRRTLLYGGLSGAAITALAFPVLGTGVEGVLVTGAAGLAAGIGAWGAGTAARFRRLVSGARLEVEGLLDRLQRGDRLDPPPSPWKRRLDRSMDRLRRLPGSIG